MPPDALHGHAALRELASCNEQKRQLEKAMVDKMRNEMFATAPQISGEAAGTGSHSLERTNSAAEVGDSSTSANVMLPGHASRKGRQASPFKPRSSRLDLETLDREQDAFRGFFTLFWIGMAFHLIVTAFNNVAQSKPLFGTRLFSLFTKNALEVLVSDVMMVSATFVAPAVHMLVVRRLLQRPFTLIFQHVYQCLFLFTAISWSLWRNWPWTASGFFCLHTIAMLMKVHSYFITNADLDAKSKLLKTLETDLAAHRDEQAQKVSVSTATGRDIARARDSRKRLSALLRDNSSEDIKAALKDEKIGEADVDVTTLEEEIKLLRGDLITGTTSYPQNVTFRNFMYYLAVPTLVYELEYPRTERVRKHYLLQKLAATAACFLLLYNTTEHYIIPVLEATPTITFAHSVISLLFPFMVCYLLIFYIIFEAICGFSAELTRFADRHFYDDWWNSVTYDEFARKWNKPVHVFLLRHVYYDSMERCRFSRSTATYLTFALSSAVHELFFAVVGRRVRMYMFAMQMLQLPLIMLGRKPAFRRHKWAGNAFFWFGMFMGPPLLAALYCREVYL